MRFIPLAVGLARRAVLRLMGIMILAGGLIDLAVAQLPTARLQATFPTGGQAGTQFDLTVTAGTDIEGLAQLHFSHPEITATPKLQVVEGQDQPTPVANQFVITIADSVPPGVYELRASGTYGITNPRAFVVGHLAEANESEPNNLPTQATAIPLESVVNGRSDAARTSIFFNFRHAKVSVW